MARHEPTRWVGWVHFAAIMLTIVGGLQVIAGLAGIFNPDFYIVQQGALLVLDFTSRGIIQLVLGVGALAAAVGLGRGAPWAQRTTIVTVVLLGIANVLLIGAYPLWSLANLVLIGIVIYAVTVHGDELKAIR